MSGATCQVIHFSASGNAALKQESGDKRIAARKRVLKAGLVAYNDRHVSVPCTVRDISDTGARLKIDGSVSAPDTFDLIVDMDGLEASCEVVWRNGKELGVRFLAAPRKVAAKRTQVITPIVPTSAPTLRRAPKPGLGPVAGK
jgi:hypothetical protein